MSRRINPIHVAVAVSVVAHFFGMEGLRRVAPSLAAPNEPIEVQFNELEPEPPPVAEPPPEPEVKPPPDPPKEVADLRAAKLEEVRDVFGVSEDSVAGEGDFSVRVGTTLMKEPEPEYVPLPLVSSLPSFKSKIEPEYPEEARRAGIEGVVILEVGIDESGRAFDVTVVQPGGHGFDESAVEAMRGSTFYPARRGEKPVAVRLRIPVRFTLR